MAKLIDAEVRFEPELNYYDRRNQFRRRLTKSQSQTTNDTGATVVQQEDGVCHQPKAKESDNSANPEDLERKSEASLRAQEVEQLQQVTNQFVKTPPSLASSASRQSYQSPNSFLKIKPQRMRSPLQKVLSPSSKVEASQYNVLNLVKVRQTVRLVSELLKPVKQEPESKEVGPPTPRFPTNRSKRSDKVARCSPTQKLQHAASKASTQLPGSNPLKTPEHLKPHTIESTYQEWLRSRVSPDRFNHTGTRQQYQQRVFTHNFSLTQSSVHPHVHPASQMDCDIKRQVQMIRRMLLNKSSCYDSISQHSIEQSTPVLYNRFQ